MVSLNRKQNFTHNIIEDKLILITGTEQEEMSLAGLFRNKLNVKGKLSTFKTKPMSIQDILNIGMSEK